MISTGFGFLAFALVSWAACFGVLALTGTWIPFAFLGVALVVLGIRSGAVRREHLRPSSRVLLQGALSGLVMVLATHIAYAVVTSVAPPVRSATRELMTLLIVPSFSRAERAVLITVIAVCEELVFRGLLPPLASATRPTRAELLRLSASTAAYALTTAPLGSPLLFCCALICGAIWAVMRLVTDSVVVPLLAHAIWDLGVLLLWPLP